MRSPPTASPSARATPGRSVSAATPSGPGSAGWCGRWVSRSTSSSRVRARHRRRPRRRRASADDNPELLLRDPGRWRQLRGRHPARLRAARVSDVVFGSAPSTPTQLASAVCGVRDAMRDAPRALGVTVVKPPPLGPPTSRPWWSFVWAGDDEDAARAALAPVLAADGCRQGSPPGRALWRRRSPICRRRPCHPARRREWPVPTACSPRLPDATVDSPRCGARRPPGVDVRGPVPRRRARGRRSRRDGSRLA